MDSVALLLKIYPTRAKLVNYTHYHHQFIACLRRPCAIRLIKMLCMHFNPLAIHVCINDSQEFDSQEAMLLCIVCHAK